MKIINLNIAIKQFFKIKNCFLCYRIWNRFLDFSGNLVLWLYIDVILDKLDVVIKQNKEFKKDIEILKEDNQMLKQDNLLLKKEYEIIKNQLILV